MYNSQYYTCEQIDQRLLQGYLDDYNTENNTSLTKAQFLAKLGSILGVWQGVDDKPIDGSNKLVKSGGVKEYVDKMAFGPKIALIANKAYNAINISVGDSFAPGSSIDASGVYCCKIAVTEGDVYRIVGNGNGYAYKTFVITDSDNKVTRLTTASNTDNELTITSGEAHLYVNLVSYDSQTDGVWKKGNIWKNIISLNEDVEQLEQDVSNSINSDTPTSEGEVQLKKNNVSVFPKSLAKIIETDEGDDLEELSYFSNMTHANYLANHYYNMNRATVGSSFTNAPAETTDNVVCGVLNNLSTGDKIKIKGSGNIYAYKTYCIVNSSNIITRITDALRTDVVLEIQEGETKLYFNLLNYNSQTDGVWTLGDTTSVKDVVNDLKENGSTVEITQEKRSVIADSAYNIGNLSVGSVFSQAISSASGFSCMWIPFFEGKIKIYGVGNNYAYRGYLFLDKNQVVLGIAQSEYNSRSVGLELTPPTGTTRILVQFTSYDAETDYVEILSSHNTKDIYDIARLPYKDKNIVCFGDSLTEFSDRVRMMGYGDYISYLSGANVIRCGIGGSQLRQRTTPVASPTTSEEAYAALDIVNMVKAACTGDFSKQNAAATWLKNNTGDDNTAIVTRLSNINWQNVDAVIIFGGTNDWNNAPTQWGTIDDNTEDTTFGAINYMVDSLLSTYKNLQIIWVTPIVRWLLYSGGTGTSDNFSDNVKKNNNTLREFSATIMQIVKNKHIPVYDAYNKLGWNMNNFSQFFEDNDGTHPYKGFNVLGEKIYNFIRSELAIKV